MALKKPSKMILSALGLILILALLTFFFWRSQNKGLQKASIKRGPIKESIYGIGTVVAKDRFQFKVGQVTTVARIYVEEGQRVQKGQTLLELAGPVKISSPLAGTVVNLPYNPGENVFPDTPVITVENLRDRYVTATLEQQGALRVKKGLPVRINFESIRDQNFQGQVESVYPSKGQFLVRIKVDNLPAEILPGMTGDTSIEVSQKENALLIPALAVNQGKVLIERNGKRKKIDVEIGSMDTEWAEVLAGDLQPEDTILLRR
jgi:macrolide-specific efflux system membrane fusion protein